MEVDWSKFFVIIDFFLKCCYSCDTPFRNFLVTLNGRILLIPVINLFFSPECKKCEGNW